MDRPGLRSFLGWVGTRQFRALTNRDVELFYDGSWFSRDGDHHLSDSVRFEYNRENLLARPAHVANTEDNCADFWFYHYDPKPGDTVVDIGAGIGHEALVFSRAVGEKGRLIAIEAHPKTFERLHKVCQYNRVANVIAKNCALVDQARVVHIGDTENHEANAVSDAACSGSIKVSGVTLDELCIELGIEHIDFLKMNIEGAEQWAIEGMSEAIAKTDCVAIACHDFLAGGSEADDRQYRTREKVRAFLEQHGFHVEDRSDDPRPYVQDHLHGWRKGRGRADG